MAERRSEAWVHDKKVVASDCHSERSEESAVRIQKQILRFTQDDGVASDKLQLFCHAPAKRDSGFQLTELG